MAEFLLGGEVDLYKTTPEGDRVKRNPISVLGEVWWNRVKTVATDAVTFPIDMYDAYKSGVEAAQEGNLEKANIESVLLAMNMFGGGSLVGAGPRTALGMNKSIFEGIISGSSRKSLQARFGKEAMEETAELAGKFPQEFYDPVHSIPFRDFGPGKETTQAMIEPLSIDQLDPFKHPMIDLEFSINKTSIPHWQAKGVKEAYGTSDFQRFVSHEMGHIFHLGLGTDPRWSNKQLDMIQNTLDGFIPKDAMKTPKDVSEALTKVRYASINELDDMTQLLGIPPQVYNRARMKYYMDLDPMENVARAGEKYMSTTPLDEIDFFDVEEVWLNQMIIEAKRTASPAHTVGTMTKPMDPVDLWPFKHRPIKLGDLGKRNLQQTNNVVQRNIRLFGGR